MNWRKAPKVAVIYERRASSDGAVYLTGGSGDTWSGKRYQHSFETTAYPDSPLKWVSIDIEINSATVKARGAGIGLLS